MQMSDYELVAQIKASEGETQKNLLGILWLRYENQVHKQWAVLRRQMNNSSLILEYHDDFYSEAYIAFCKAVNAVDLEKVRDDKWRFVGYFFFYLQNLRTDTITLMLHRAKREISLYVETDEGEVSRVDLEPLEDGRAYGNPEADLMAKADTARVQEAVNHCMSIWDDRKKEIYRLRQEGYAKGVAAEKLGVHPATITYHLQMMQKDLEKELKAL